MKRMPLAAWKGLQTIMNIYTRFLAGYVAADQLENKTIIKYIYHILVSFCTVCVIFISFW